MSYPIIYKPGTTDFDNLGLGLLTDTEKAIVTEELNGQFIFEFTYPVGGALDSAIEEQAFVKVDAGNVLKGQIFEIKKITSDTTYNRSVYAEHISYRLNGIPTKAYTATGNGLQMLTAWKAQLLYGSDLFTVKSDVTTQSTGTFTPQTFGNARTVLGGQEGSILDLVGGQYKFDNFEVSLLNQRGKESHDMLVYGKNITTLTQEENITSTYNAIYPYAQFTDDSDSKKTIVKTLPETIVESKYFDNFNAPVIQVVDFSDKFTGDNAIKSYTDDKLRAFAKQYITNNKVGIPEVSIDLSTVDMNKALGENVESLDLGDTIKVYFQALRINTLAQVSAITWNVLLDQYDSYTIGAKKRTLTQQFINNVASAKETADKALHIAQGAAIASADGKNTDYYGNSINDPFPANPKVGDKYFVKDGDDEYIFMWDGTTWVELVSTKTGEYIANKVDEAIETAKSQAAAMDAVRASEAAEFQSEANTALSSAASERESLAAEADSIASSAAHQLQLATSERTAFSSAATSMANSAASRANSMASSAAAYGKAQAASALSDANVALSEAKYDLTTAIGQETEDRNKAVSAVNSQAQDYANQAKSDINDTINALSVGGRNLLLDTGRSFTGIGTNFTHGSFIEQGGKYYLAGGKKVSDLYNQYGSSGYLTLSFDWVASGSTISGQFNSEWNSAPWLGLGDSHDGSIKPSSTNTSGHYEATVPLNTNGYATGTATDVRFRHDNLQGNVTISNVKLEAGNKATDWTPAPEDVVLDYTTKDNKIKETITQYQDTNDGKVTKAQTDATTALGLVATKVSQTDYDQKTGELSSNINTATQTATETKNELANVSKTVDSQSSKINTISNTVDGTTQSISDIQTEQGKQSGSIATLQSRADGFDATVTKVNNLAVGGRNLIKNGDIMYSWVGEHNVTTNDGALIYTQAPFAPAMYQIEARAIDDSIIGADFGWQWSGELQGDTIKLTTDWQKASALLEFNKPIGLGVRGGLGLIELRFVKAEKGNIATDWSPAPEDLSSATAKAQLTADKATLDLSNYKTDADGRIKKAQADITATANAVSTKVSQSDYDKKTQDLDTKYGQVKTTADAVTAEVTKYESANDKKVSANTASINTLNNQITSKVSQTDFDKTTGDLSGKYSVQQQTINGISQTVTELQAKANAQGQVNQLMNTEFTPDFQGWDMSETWAGTLKPYRSIIYDGSNTVGLNTQKNTDKTYTTMKQLIPFTLSGSNKVVSVSWQSIVYQVDQYSTVHVRSYDANMTRLTDVSVGNWGQKTLKTWGVGKFENISIPDNASFIEVLWSAREGFLGYMEKPMLVFADHVGDYVPGNYNNNARVAELEVSLDGITGLVKDPKNGLSATATLAANGMTVATNAQSAASTAIQKADGIQTTVESMQAINQFINTEFTPDLEGWTTTSTDGKRNPYKSYLDKNVKAMTVGFYTVGADTSKGNYFAKFQQTVPLTNSSNGYLSLSWQSYLKSMDDGMYGHLWVIFHDKDGNVVYNSGGANKMGNWISNGQATWTRQKMEKVEIPNVATSVDISFEAREGISAYLVRPMIVFDDHIGDVYVAGPYNNNSSMQSIRTQLADQITDEVEDRKTGDKSTVTQLTGVINQKVVDITQGYTSLNTQTSQLFETKIKNVADQVNSMGQVNQLTNTEFMPDLEGWESITEGGTSKAPYRSYWQGNIQATVVGFDTRNAASNTWATFKQNFQLASSPGTGHQISMSWASWASQTNNYNGLYARFFDKSGTKVGESYREWSYTDKPADNAWLQRKKWEGIDVPDTAVSCTVIFQAREGTLAYLGQPMVVLGSTIGSYTPGTYNNNNLVESTRTQLAGMIQDKVDDVGGQIKSLSTQTAGQFTTEIQDRKNGDTNTLTQAKNYTVSQIKDAKSGLESEISQSADGIIASVSQVNRLFNTQFSPDLQGWNVNNNGAGGFHYNFYRSYLNNGATVVGVDTTKATVDGTTTTYFSYFEQDVALPGNNSGTYLSMSWDVTTNVMDKYAHLFIQFKDANGATTGSAWTNWNSTIGAGWTHKVWENITIPSDAHHIRVSFQVREGSNLYLVRPMLTFTKTAQPYMPGGYHSTDTVLQLFKDNWAIGIQDNSGKLITGINGDTSNTRIVGKQITLDGNVSVTGDFYALGGNFKNLNASNITVGTLNGANLNIINLDAGSISTGTLNGAKANITNINASNINTGNFNASLITTGQLNAKVLTGDTGHLGTTDTGRIINKQDNHLQLAAKSMYNNSTNRAQLELLANTSDVDDSMKGTLNYYSNPTNSGHGLGIRFKANQILAIDEDGGSKNLYLSPYSGGQVRIVSRDLSTYYDIAAAHFNVSSQRKFKTNITDLEDNALDIVNNTKIHRYTKNGQTEIGVIADETDERLLTDDKKFVSIYDYTSVLYKAVQELSAEIEALKNERSNSQQPSD